MKMKKKKKKSNGSRAKRATAKANRRTDWSGLRRRKPGAIRKGIATDRDAHATNAAFWKSAQVVLPTPKEAVTMRLNADLLLVPPRTRLPDPHQCHPARLHAGA